MWPVNAQKVLQTMSKYMKEATPEPSDLPALPPKTLRTTQGSKHSIHSTEGLD
jgi:hypothetical protein